MSFCDDMLWEIIRKHIESVYEDSLDLSIIGSFQIGCHEEHKQVQVLGIYLSADINLLRNSCKTLRKVIDRHVTYRYDVFQKRYIISFNKNSV